MRVKDAKMAAKLQLQLQDSVEGRITQQSAEDASHATFRQSGVDVEDLWSLCARSAGLIPPVNSALVRALANHTPLAPKGTIAADPQHRHWQSDSDSDCP